MNERLETSAAEVWAIGECAGSPQFTHVSVDDFRIIRDNLAGTKRSTHDRLVPYCMFTDPPLAHVGLSEGDAQRQGLTARVAKLPMSAVLRAQTTDERQGFMKALVSASDDRILGFTMIGAEAGEVPRHGANSDAGRPALFEAPRRRAHASDNGGGPRPSFLECAAPNCREGRVRVAVVGEAAGDPVRLIGHRFHNPCDGMRNARLKREDAFSHAMIIVSSAIVSSS